MTIFVKMEFNEKMTITVKVENDWEISMVKGIIKNMMSLNVLKNTWMSDEKSSERCIIFFKKLVLKVMATTKARFEYEPN